MISLEIQRHGKIPAPPMPALRPGVHHFARCRRPFGRDSCSVQPEENVTTDRRRRVVLSRNLFGFQPEFSHIKKCGLSRNNGDSLRTCGLKQ